MQSTIYTVGHGARSSLELISILKDSEIETLVDVRAYPVSRRHPQFARDLLSQSLAQAGIAYDWQGRPLGGYRSVPYVEHMKTAAFREAAEALAACAKRVCVMCAETNPDDCHRLHIADWLAGRGRRVVHLLAQGRSREHVRNPQEDLWPDA